MKSLKKELFTSDEFLKSKSDLELKNEDYTKRYVAAAE